MTWFFDSWVYPWLLWKHPSLCAIDPKILIVCSALLTLDGYLRISLGVYACVCLQHAKPIMSQFKLPLSFLVTLSPHVLTGTISQVRASGHSRAFLSLTTLTHRSLMPDDPAPKMLLFFHSSSNSGTIIFFAGSEQKFLMGFSVGPSFLPLDLSVHLVKLEYRTFLSTHFYLSPLLQELLLTTWHSSLLLFFSPTALLPGTHPYIALATTQTFDCTTHFHLNFFSFDPHHLRLIFLSSHPPPSGSMVKILSSVSSPSTILFSFSVPGYTPLWLIVCVRLSWATLWISQEKALFLSLVKKKKSPRSVFGI